MLTDYLQRGLKHIETEFRRYGFDAVSVMISHDESISVVAMRPGSADTAHWSCVIGSDDDYYVFTQNDDDPHFDHYRDVITIPLMPESEVC